MKMGLQNIKVDYHRNGIGGEGFYPCTFEWEDHRMVAIVFDEPTYCAVLDIDMLAMGNITFSSNSWRGDNFEPELRDAIEAWSKELDKRLGITEEECGWEG